MPAGRPKFGLETVVVALGSLTNRPLGRPTNRASTYLARYTQAATVDTVAAARYCHKLRQLVFPSCQARALLSLAPWIPVTFVSARARCGVVMRGAHYHHSSGARARANVLHGHLTFSASGHPILTTRRPYLRFYMP